MIYIVCKMSAILSQGVSVEIISENIFYLHWSAQQKLACTFMDKIDQERYFMKSYAQFDFYGASHYQSLWYTWLYFNAYYATICQ